MAKKLVVSPDEKQIALIDTEHPQFKPLKAAIRSYNKNLEQKNAFNQAAKKDREKILELARATGAKPDIDGVIAITMNGLVIKIVPGESQLKIKEENAPDPKEVDGTDGGPY